MCGYMWRLAGGNGVIQELSLQVEPVSLSEVLTGDSPRALPSTTVYMDFHQDSLHLTALL